MIGKKIAPLLSAALPDDVLGAATIGHERQTTVKDDP
jgi:hypothetical protein